MMNIRNIIVTLTLLSAAFSADAAIFIGAEKRWADGRHNLSAVAFAAANERGLQAASTREAYTLTGDNFYNPAWGWQNGRVRNSRTSRGADPTVIVSHMWRPREGTTLTTGLAAYFALYSITGLNHWGDPDPRPDYYA